MTESEGLMFERINSLLNNSPTKQAYSFGRAVRFKKLDKKDYSFVFYDLPEKRCTRGTTLGYGKKCNYDKLVGCGSNQLYAAPSYFDPKYHNAPIYSFGVSRSEKIRDNCSPGPKYNCSSQSIIVPSYIFGKSGDRDKRMKRTSSLPGPGSYYNAKNHLLSTSISSKLLNSANIIIGNAKRFPNDKRDTTPGPGEYEIKGLINNSGFLYNSKYSSIPAKSILGSRNNENLRKQFISPGPGQYNSFSIFEGYSREKK